MCIFVYVCGVFTCVVRSDRIRQAHKLRGEADVLSTSNQALLQERAKDQMLLDSLNADIRQLRVEEVMAMLLALN